MPVHSISKVYADVNKNKPKEYYDYESLQLQNGSIEAYQLVRKLGHGKYSEVFEGRKDGSEERLVIKILKVSSTIQQFNHIINN